MFGSIKKAMVAGAVVAVGALAGPAIASADVWSVDGTSEYAGPAHVEGTLTLSLLAPGTPQTTCNVTATIDLDNGGVSPNLAQGTVTSFYLTDCTTTAPNCTVTATANTTPSWEISTSGTIVTISGIQFTNVYAGDDCELNGVSLGASGSLSSEIEDNVLPFVNAAGLTTAFGPGVVNGAVEVYAEDGNGDPDYNAPVTLIPNP